MCISGICEANCKALCPHPSKILHWGFFAAELIIMCLLVSAVIKLIPLKETLLEECNTKENWPAATSFGWATQWVDF